MGLLDRPQQSQRFGLLSGDAMSLINRGANGTLMPAPAQAPAPARRPRVSGWRVFDRVLGGQTVTEGLDAERERLEAEPMREASRARMLRLQSYVDSLSPDLQLAYEANREKLGEAFASRGEAVTLNRGDVRMEGNRPVYAAPFDAAPGASIFNPLNPSTPLAVAAQENKVAGGALVAPDGRVLYRGPAVEGVAATSDAYVTPEIAQGEGGGAPAIARSAFIAPDVVSTPQGGTTNVIDPRTGQIINSVQGNPGRSGPELTRFQERQLEEYYGDLASIDAIDGELGRFDGMIASGELDLGPLENFAGGVRNAVGMSSQNSRNMAEFRSTLERIRNDSLRLNKGVQTEGDAQRAWNELVTNINDPAVVRQQLARIQALNARARTFRQQRISALEGGGPGGQPAPAAQSPAGGAPVSVSTPAQAQALPPGTRYRTPDGQEYVR